MAQVAFWSPVHGQPGTTSNMIAASCVTALEHMAKTLVTHTQWSHSTLEQAFFDHKEPDRSLISFSDHGIDALERLVRSNRLTTDTIKDYTHIVYKDRLDLLMGTTKPSEEIYSNISQVVTSIFEIAKNHYDLLFVDVNSGFRNELTNEVLRNSDVIVVNLNQNMFVVDQFFSEMKDVEVFANKKIIYVLGNYEANSRFSVKKFTRDYGLKDNIFTIPRCPQYADEVNEHNVKEFFLRNMKVRKNDVNYSFITEARKLSKAILRECGLQSKILEEKGA